MNDYEMRIYLTEMGYDITEDESDDVNVSVLCEMAINEGFRWDESTEKWI